MINGSKAFVKTQDLNREEGLFDVKKHQLCIT